MPLYGRHQRHAIHGSWWRQETPKGRSPRVRGYLALYATWLLKQFTWPGDRAGTRWTAPRKGPLREVATLDRAKTSFEILFLDFFGDD